MGATSTGTPKRGRRVKRDFVVRPSYLLGSCDLCHRAQQLVSEVRLPNRHLHYRWYVVCALCLDQPREQLRQRSIFNSALSEHQVGEGSATSR